MSKKCYTVLPDYISLALHHTFIKRRESDDALDIVHFMSPWGAVLIAVLPRRATASPRNCSLLNEARHSAPCVLHQYSPTPYAMQRVYCGVRQTQSGATYLELFALLLLMLPLVLTFQTLFEFVTRAERNQQLRADKRHISLQPCATEHRSACFGRGLPPAIS